MGTGRATHLLTATPPYFWLTQPGWKAAWAGPP
jgi:hypothetical protein